MEDTKALSPEARGLFDTIRTQAHQFADAFSVLDKEIAELGSLKKEVTKIAEMLTNDVNDAITDLNNSVTGSLAILESKTIKTQRIYSELEDVAAIKVSLAELRDVLKKQSVEIESAVSTFNQKADIELDSIIESSKSRIQKEIENEISKVEIKLALKLRQMDSKFLTYDQKLYAFAHSFGKEERDLGNELENLRKKFAEIRSKTEELQNSMYERIDIFDKDISKKVELIESMILSFEMKFKNKFDDENSRYTPEDNAKEIKSLKEIIAHNNEQLKQLDKKKNLALFLAGLSIVGLIIVATASLI